MREELLDDQDPKLIGERSPRRGMHGLAGGQGAHERDGELARLRAVRERLARREAWRATLQRRADQLDRSIEALERRSDDLAARLAGQHRRVRTLERELDRAVPRLLARLRELRESRETTAQAVAGLAALSRNSELDGTDKARLLAISPVILERLNTAEARSKALRERLDAIVAAHERARAGAAATVEEISRVQGRRAGMRAAHARALAGLPAIRTEVAGLRAEQQALASRVLARRHAQAAGAWRPGRPAPDRPGTAQVRVAAVAGWRHLAYEVDGVQQAKPRLVARTPRPDLDRARIETARRIAGPAPVETADAVLRGGLGPALPDAAPRVARLLDRRRGALLPPAPSGGVAHVQPSRVAPANPPIALLPREILAHLGPRRPGADGPGVTIPAARGQAVAAPQEGRIVFAGDFRSYGLLLIIAHEREYHTLLWGFSELAVQVGDRVHSGQVVGVMGRQGEPSPRLHVELRQHGRPVSPRSWLAANTSKVRG